MLSGYIQCQELLQHISKWIKRYTIVVSLRMLLYYLEMAIKLIVAKHNEYIK